MGMQVEERNAKLLQTLSEATDMLADADEMQADMLMRMPGAVYEACMGTGSHAGIRRFLLLCNQPEFQQPWPVQCGETGLIGGCEKWLSLLAGAQVEQECCCRLVNHCLPAGCENLASGLRLKLSTVHRAGPVYRRNQGGS